MQNPGVHGGGGGRVIAEDVISKLKDDGDFDRLRVKIIRTLKENEELRSNIISMVKQSAVLNRPGVENMKPRQLSEAIHQEIGDKAMNQISDGVWNVIKSADGMKKEITETVQSVYDKLSNPITEEDNGESSSSHKDSRSILNQFENNCEAMENVPPGFSMPLSDGEPNVPPGFSMPLSTPQNTKDDGPPGFPSILKLKNSGDAIDEDDDPDVPPGFG